MRNTTLLLFLALSVNGFLFPAAFANTWEVGVSAAPGTRVRIYHNSIRTHNSSAGSYYSTTSCNNVSANWYVDNGDDNTGGVYGPALEPGERYTLVVGGWAVDFTAPGPEGNRGDFIIEFRAALSPHFVLHACTASTSLSNERAWLEFDVTVRNSFDAGIVKADGVEYASGTTFGWSGAHTLEAIDGQSIGGYIQRYQDWTKPNLDHDQTNPLPITVTGDGTYTANFAKEFNIWFENSFVGVGNKGVIKVNGTEYQLPLSQPFHVVGQQNPPGTITAEALPQAVNGIYYSFTQWEDGSTENPRTFTPTDHATYRAHYAGKPVAVTMKSLGGPVGEPVQIVWYNHVNPNVTQYQVWRKVKHNGVVGDPVLLATVNRPDSSYTDYDYLNTGSYTDDLLYYDARAYYSIEGSYADPHYTATFGEEALPKIVGGGAELFIADVGEKPYSVSVSPNPFNSMAVIRFFLRERGHVVLSVMDILGREVIRLIDEEKESGRACCVL